VPFSGREAAKKHFQEVFEPKYGKVFSDYLYSNLSKQEDGSYSWRFHKEGVLKCLDIGREQDFWDEFESVKTSSLVIRGENSNHLPAEVYQDMLRRNLNASGVEISGAGHWVHFDQFSEFVTQVDKFLSE
jgi:pimeloyl-ACP methyl ester carboxylesterase